MSAASAVCAALRARDPSVATSVVDSYKYAASVVSSVVSNGYLGMVKTIPQMYRFLYNRAERATEVGAFRTWIHQFTASNLRPLLEEMQPDVVVCTHAFPCGVMAEYKRQFADAPPVVGIVTDFAVHAFWIHKNVEGYAVATGEMRDVLANRGIAADRIVVSGIPVDAAFVPQGFDRDALRKKLDLPLDRKVVLLMAGGLGMGPLETMMKAVGNVDDAMCAVVMAGRNQRMRRRVLEAAHQTHYPLRVLDFVSNVPEYMHAADVLLTKPGGLTTSEAMVAGVPMVLFKPLPGQEERNTRYLVDRDVAVRAKTAADLTRTLREVLQSPERRDRMRAAMRGLACPYASERIAGLIAQLAASTKQTVNA